MSIKSFFNHLAEKREAKRKYKALAAAIRADDLDGVRAALAAGADASYLPGLKTEKIPMSLALKQNNAKIFEALLDTDAGMTAAFIWYPEFRVLRKDRNNFETQVYFTPSYLYAAIEEGKEEIAIILAGHKGVDVEKSGDVFGAGGNRWADRDKYKDLVKSPLALAREKGQTSVAKAIEERLKPIMTLRAQREAEDLAAQAAAKRAEAEKLLKEADLLQPKRLPQKPGFKL